MKISNFKVIVIIIVCLVGVTGWFTLFGGKGWFAYLHLIQVRKEMQQQVLEVEAENRKLTHEIYRLKHDKDYFERVIRKQLEMGKPDELVFKFR